MSRRAEEPGAGLSERILARKDEVARSVTAEFLRRHPDWVERFGEERTRRFGVEDAGHHVDFLAGALVADSIESFRRYASWAARVLESRGIEPRFLAENLQQIGSRLSDALPDDEAERVRRFVEAGVRACQETDAATGEPPDAGSADDTLQRYLEAALRGDRKAAASVAQDALRNGMSAVDLYMDVLQEAQYEIGRRWAENRISVAQEHTATMVAQYVLVRLYDELPRPERLRGRAVVTGVEGELHQIGANMVSDVLEMDGWNVRFLGTQMPHGGIVEAVSEQEAELVGVSVTMLFNLPRVADLVERLREASPDRPPRILVGGGAFRAEPEAWRRVGADAFGRDLTEAVAEAAALASGAEAERGAPDGSDDWARPGPA